MASRSEFLSCAALLLFACPGPTRADTLTITSTPPGATVEVDGIAKGTTPYQEELPGGFFHKTKTPLGKRLEYPMVVRISLAGYTTKELQITEGPMNWISAVKKRDYGQYWLLKTNKIHVDLVPISQTFTGKVAANLGTNALVNLQPGLSSADLVERAKPAVVYLRSSHKTGSGFLVTETGVIATNAHLAHGEESLLALLPGGQQLDAKVIHVDPDLDIAVAKIEGNNFPHLVLADTSTVRQGENVLAIGNPGGAMLFSVTKGIVSAMGEFPSAGPGTWIQTDAPINPGNSGGPLLNARGEAIGITTLKVVKKEVAGIGFALSASDLLEVLQRFYPDALPLTEKLSAPAVAIEAPPISANSFGTVLLAEPEGAEIWLDRKFVGNVPATLRLAVGDHLFVVRVQGHADWIRSVKILNGSKQTLIAVFE